MIRSMIFFPEKTFYEKPENYGFEYEEVRIQSTQGAELFGWFLKGKNSEKFSAAKPVVLFLHGNAGNISHRVYKVQGWIDQGFSVFLIDYRGYGKSTGEIQNSEDTVDDGKAALQWLRENKKIPLEKIVLYGESLGTYPAIRLAASEKTAALVLEAPFTSFVDLGTLHYPFVSKEVIKGFEFPNIEWIGKVRIPLFIIHGTEDEICPYAMAGELFEKAPEPKGFLSVPMGTHNGLPAIAGDDFWRKPIEFVGKYLK